MNQRNDHGLFIVFEGIDGAGTTTQCARYARHVRSHRRQVHVTCEPSGGPIGALLRLGLNRRVDLGGTSQAQTMALLFAADRLDHVAHEVEPHLRDGSVVICDRYDLSSIAYQKATGPAEDGFVDWLQALNRYAIRPDVVVLLEVSPDEAERRRQQRAGAPELYEKSQLQRKVAEVYADAERFVGPEKLIKIPGDGSADEVEAAIIKALASFLERPTR